MRVGGRPVRCVATCRTCNAEIFWALTTSDKLIPIDVEPVATGNIEIELDELDGKNTAVVVDPSQPSLFGKPRYNSHFVTCPDANKHRRKR